MKIYSDSISCNLYDNFLLVLGNVLEGLCRCYARVFFKYSLAKGRDEEDVKGYVPYDYNDLWKYYLKQLISSFYEKYFFDRIDKQMIYRYEKITT